MGAAVSLLGFALAPERARAADVVCAPNASGTAIANATETCSGVGDKIDYSVAPATVNSTVTLNAVNIPNAAINGVAINPGTTSQTVLSSGGSIKAVGGDGIRILATSGTGTQSVGTASNLILTPITGGTGATAANGIRIDSLGDANVFAGNVALTSTSTSGASWGVRARSLTVGSAPGGAVVVVTQGPVSGPAGIQATTTGTDVTDTVTVATAGPVTGAAGAGIQVRSVNGNSVVTVGAPVVGATGTASHGIDVQTNNGVNNGTGNVSVTTAAGATVTANAGTIGILIGSGTGGMSINVGADVTSTGNTAIKTNSFASASSNVITIGTANIRGLGTTNLSGSIDMTSPSGGLTVLNTATGTAIFSDSATAALQNGDLAIKGTGGNVVINHAGSIRGTMEFQNLSVVTNNVTLNNSSTGVWHTANTTNFSAGNDVVNNNGLIGTNALAPTFASTLAFGTGTDTFNNNATGTLFAAEAAGPSLTTFSGLEVFNNAGTISLQDGETNDLLDISSAAFSGSGTIKVDASLAGGGGPPGCTASVADCVRLGAVSGKGTIVVNDTSATTPGALSSTPITVAHVTSGNASNFVLGGANVVSTQQGPAIPKGFAQYQLAFDPVTLNYNLVTVIAAPTVEMGNVMEGMQNLWNMTSEGASQRVSAIRHSVASDSDGKTPIPAQAGTFDGYSFWGKAYFGGAAHNTSRTADGAWVFGALLGYSESTLKFEVDNDKTHYSVWHFGAYGSYISGPLFVDFLLKDDSTKVKFDFPVSSLEDRSGNSIGAKVTVGERLEDSGIVFEPMVTASLVHSSLDTLKNPSASFAFADGNSIRALIGLQISGNVGGSAMAVEPFVFAGVGNEFDGQNSVNVSSGGTLLEIKDRPIRVFAAGSVGFNVLGNNGFSAYLRADGLVASHANSVALWAGLRVGL
jgi:hypothetical protein